MIINTACHDQIILEQYSALIRRVMREQQARGSVIDVYQAAALGVLEAARTMPPTGAAFISHAYRRATYAVKHYLPTKARNNNKMSTTFRVLAYPSNKGEAPRFGIDGTYYYLTTDNNTPLDVVALQIMQEREDSGVGRGKTDVANLHDFANGIKYWAGKDGSVLTAPLINDDGSRDEDGVHVMIITVFNSGPYPAPRTGPGPR